MNLYCISGLGADERLFRNLKPEGYDLRFINWVKPDKRDTIGSYTDKLISQIDQTRSFALLGVSLGGVMAVELSGKTCPEKVFVISSVKSSKEFPFYIKMLHSFRFIISARLLKSCKLLLEFFFGKMNKWDKVLISKMIDDSDDIFLPWAAKAILAWHSDDAQTPFEKIVHLVGDQDLIFRHSNIHDCLVVKGGSHVMILNKTGEINNLIEKEGRPGQQGDDFYKRKTGYAVPLSGDVEEK